MSGKAQFRLRIDANRRPALGPGKIALLEAIIQTGSISAAARKLGMSYRRAWLLIEDLNRHLRTPAVLAAKGGKRGGGSQVTQTGKTLVQLYRGIEQNAYSAARVRIRALTRMLAR